MRGASHHPVFMGDCLTIVTCVLPCLPEEGISFCVPGAIEEDAAWVSVKSGLRCMLLPKVYATLSNGDRVWE